jgi:hypothetical protein
LESLSATDKAQGSRAKVTRARKQVGSGECEENHTANRELEEMEGKTEGERKGI